MANFTTHIAIGTVASGLAATAVMASNIVTPEQLLTLCAAGALGSVLPDVDLKDSRPSEAMFNMLGVFIAFVVLFHIGWKYSIAEMWILWAAVYVGVRYIGGWVFHRLSYHRGIYHSLLAASFFAFLTAAVYRHILGTDETVAWLGGAFMFLGYIVHLTLDEIYSVDVMDVRVKASFGTALKLFDTKHLGQSAFMAVAAVLAFLVTPAFAPTWKAISQPEIRTGLHDRLLPKQGWFGFAGGELKLPNPFRRADKGAPAAVPDGATPVQTQPSSITTGSVTVPAAQAPAHEPAAPAAAAAPSQSDPKEVPAPSPVTEAPVTHRPAADQPKP